MIYSKDNMAAFHLTCKMGLVSQPHRMNSIKAQKTNSLFK